MSRQRGLHLKLIREFIVKNYGESGLAKVKERLAPEIRAQLDTRIAVWVENAIMLTVVKEIAAVSGQSEEESMHAIGAYNAETTLNTFYRFVLALASPEKVCQRFPEIWASSNDTGKIVEMKIEERQAAGALEGFRDAGIICHAICGFLERALEMAGAKHPVVTHPECAGKGGALCRFEVRWE